MKSFVLNGVRFIKYSKQSISPLGHPYNLCIEFKPNTFCFGKFSCCDEYVEIECIRFFFFNKKFGDCLFIFKELNKNNEIRNYGIIKFLSSDYSLFKKMKLLE